MHCLSDIKDLALKNGCKKVEFNGYSLTIGKNTYAMAHGDFYCNGTIISKADLLKKLNSNSKRA